MNGPSPFCMTRRYALELVNDLTPREKQIVERVAFGMSRREIATELRLSVKTLHSHFAHVRLKWRVPVHGWGRVWFCSLIED